MSKTTAQKILSAPNGYTDESREVAEAYLKLLDPWISVLDELPEENQRVLYYVKTEELKNQDYFWQMGCTIYRSGAFHASNAYELTHWMPAPKHPK